MKTTVSNPCFKQWHKLMLAGDKDLWHHLRLMERGDHGHFSQRIYEAMSRADQNNKCLLYGPFAHLFNPR